MRRLRDGKGSTDGKQPNRQSGGGEMMGVGDQEGGGSGNERRGVYIRLAPCDTTGANK